MAVLSVLGVIIGGFMGQPTLGFLAGLGLGGVIALFIWLAGRSAG